MATQELPTLVYHADWGITPEKRWSCRAVRQGNGYKVEAPEPVGDLGKLSNRIKNEIGATGVAVVGFDFPIGIPAKYGSLVGVTEFRPFLLRLGNQEYSDFYRICAEPSEISKHRPFYPYRSGGTKQSDLLSALGLTSFNDLRRTCERAYDGRKAACPLFWTLGASQVGRAAIIGWRDVITPALRNDPSVVLWPFDGSVDSLSKPGHIVILETYPAECYQWFFRDRPLKAKGELENRKRVGRDLLEWVGSAKAKVTPSTALERRIRAGFPAGDDAFDAVVGLFGMMDVLINGRSSGEPQDESITKLEGWIFGQSYGPNISSKPDR
jgi:hypothetical protein